MSTSPGATFRLYSSNWSGGEIPAAHGQSFAEVSAEWVVPQVSQVPLNGETLTDVAEWIGLDGFNSNDVCQAGVLQTVQTAPNGKTTVSYTAWDEWYPGGARLIPSSDFAVSPGDTIKITVDTIGAGARSASFIFDDVTTGQTYEAVVHAPRGVGLQGNSAEYIVETPELVANNGAVTQPLLADFLVSRVVFREASATYADGMSASLSRAHSVSMATENLPGLAGTYVQEDTGTLQRAADKVTVTENPYWTVG